MKIQHLIKSKRLELGYTLRELGDLVGVTHSTILRWESGDIASMKNSKLMLLAKALEISPAELIDAGEETLSAPLSSEEETILAKIRSLDSTRKGHLLYVLDMLYRDQKGDTDEKA